MPQKKDCSFFLKEPGSAIATLIYFHMTLPDGKVKRSIGLKILPTNWAGQRAAGGTRSDREINQMIDSIINMIPGLKSECRRNNRVISCADVHAALDVILQDTRPEKEREVARDMFADLKTIIQGMKDGSITTKGRSKKKYSVATIGNYELRALPKIEEFYTEKKKVADWEGVTIELYEEFITWCHAQNLSNNSIGTYVKCWKRSGKIALKKKWHSNEIFKDEDFITLKEETPDIYLDDTKIARIYKQKLTDENNDLARDWAVLDCFLGLRISDLRKVSANDFTGDLFQFVNQKTGAHVAIPIHKYARAILKKWNGLPPAMKDSTFRDNIKQVAKLADIKNKFIYTATIGGEVKSFEYEEWQCVSPHTFRRSFITNLLKMGIPHAKVMKLAGIKKYDTLMRYFKQTTIEVAQEMKDHEYFK